jgi:hypothetical protein
MEGIANLDAKVETRRVGVEATGIQTTAGDVDAPPSPQDESVSGREATRVVKA